MGCISCKAAYGIVFFWALAHPLHYVASSGISVFLHHAPLHRRRLKHLCSGYSSKPFLVLTTSVPALREWSLPPLSIGTSPRQLVKISPYPRVAHYSVRATATALRTQQSCEAQVVALQEDVRRSNRAWEGKIARKVRQHIAGHRNLTSILVCHFFLIPTGCICRRKVVELNVEHRWRWWRWWWWWCWW